MASSSDTASASADEFPQIPGYRIDGVVGRGATGVVYRATQLAVDRPVALKILRAELVGTKRAVRRLQREARTAARLAHPSIISAIDMGEVNGVWWYAMELVEGEALSERIASRGRLSEREVLRLFTPLCDALQHAYEGGVVHRDIKPANILVDHHGRARLVDLGLAFAEDDPLLTKPGGTLGTPHYISPEQARDPSSADTRSDIWSLGATMYQALCGRPPFEGVSVAEILSSVLYRRIPDPRQLAPHLSRGISFVVRKCLNRDPSRRYQEPDELMRDLERLRERRAPEIQARALDPVARDARFWRDPRLLAITGGGVALAALLVAALGGWFGVWGPSVGGEGVGDVLGEPLVWPEVDQVERTFKSGRVRHHGALLELEGMDVPARFQVGVNELKTLILVDLDRALGELRVGIEDSVAQRVEVRDWDGARALLSGGVERVLETGTGFARPADLPTGRREETERWVSGLVRATEAGFSEALGKASDALRGHYLGPVCARVGKLRADRRWRDALALIDSPVRPWLDAGGADLRGFDAGSMARIAESISVERNADRKDLRGDWLQVAGRLVRWVDGTQETLRASLEGGDERDVGGQLRDAFARRLGQEKVERSQVPEAWDHRPFRRAEAAAGELDVREAALLEVFARRSYEDDLELTAGYARRRDYSAALRHWRLRAADPLFAALTEELELRVRESELLQGLLERAAAGIEKRRGERFECFVGNILERGTVRLSVEPLRRGFELETGQRSVRLHFSLPPGGELPGGEALLRGADIERLADLTGAGLSAPDELLAALFRYHEGELAGAQAALPLGALPGDGLLDDLEERIRVARNARSAREQAREGDLAALIRSIKWNFEQSQYVLNPRKLHADIEAVRERYGDILTAEERDDLRDIQEAVDRSLSGPTVEEALGPFAPGDLVRHAPLGLELRFHFDGLRAGAWKPGAWEQADGGWSLSEALDGDGVFLDGESAVRLELADPFDCGERIKLRLEFDPVWTAGLENTLLISVAGFHIALLDDPASPRVLVGTDGEAQVLERVRRGDASGFGSFAGLPRERGFVIEISVSPAVGKLDHVIVDGEELTVRTHYRRPPAGHERVSVRSMQPVLLVGARIEGRRER